MSKVRRTYVLRLVFRIIVFAFVLYEYFVNETFFDVILKWNMFKEFSVLDILLVLWIIDMLWQIVPSGWRVALGSQKLFLNRFKGVNLKEIIKDKKEKIEDSLQKVKLLEYIKTTTIQAYKVLLLWCALLVVIGILYFMKVLTYKEIFLIVCLFYVCDLICVLVWCPFRLIMKNRCCTTCRIFNWDHLMMFTPFIFVNGFYAKFLLLFSIVVFLFWEFSVMVHPERFSEITNVSLRCSECTDKLCTQYCQKLRK